jgi:hypothetical protein
VFDVTKRAPKDDIAWIAVRTDAAALAEVGNLILTLGRLRENGQPVPRTADFKRHVQAPAEAAKGAQKSGIQEGCGRRVRGLRTTVSVQRRFLDAASNSLGECDYAGACERKLFAVYIT